MREKHHEITCIICPLGCKIMVTTSGDTIKYIRGHTCKQGVGYARSEALDPRRMLTTSVAVKQGQWPLVSVKSTQPVPKKDIFSVLDEIRHCQVKAPVKTGDVLLKNVAHTGIDIIATKTINTKKE